MLWDASAAQGTEFAEHRNIVNQSPFSCVCADPCAQMVRMARPKLSLSLILWGWTSHLHPGLTPVLFPKGVLLASRSLHRDLKRCATLVYDAWQCKDEWMIFSLCTMPVWPLPLWQASASVLESR